MNNSVIRLFTTFALLLAFAFSPFPHHQQILDSIHSPSAIFGKITPIDQSAFLSVWTLTLDWADMAGTVDYQYCYDQLDNDACDSSWVSTGTDTFSEITYLQAQTKYYWQVRAFDGIDTVEANEGEWWEFETGGYARFHVQIIENNVSGYDWRPGISVTVTLDDPSNGPGVDFSDTKTTDPVGTVIFDNLNGITLGTGMVITMTDGVVFKAHTVVALEVTGVDEENDIVWGTGAVGAPINAQYCQYNGCDWRRYTTVQPDGNWLVNFSVPGSSPDEQLLLDIVPGTTGETLTPDPDGDHTDVNWRVNQKFEARPVVDRINGEGWIEDAILTVEINDPATPSDPDYSDSVTVIRNPGDPTRTFFHLDLSGQYDLQPGDIITITDGTATKIHTVTELGVLKANASTDIVSGLALPETYVDIMTCGISQCFYRTVLSDALGYWSANFSEPGDQPWEQTVTDILPDTVGNARQWDPDIDSTLVDWSVSWEIFLPLLNK
jgi:hypothetical protein